MRLEIPNPTFRFVPPGYDRVQLAEDLTVAGFQKVLAGPSVPGYSPGEQMGEYQVFKLTVPAGRISDLESIPPIVAWIPGLKKLGRGTIPGVIHDELYATGLVSRPLADVIYLCLQKHFGASWLARWTKYLAVRCFGWIPWNGHRRRDRP